VSPDSGDVESIIRVRRRWGKLYAVMTSNGVSYLVLRDPSSERFLNVGAALDRDSVEMLAGPVARTAGLALAYRLLAIRDRTEHEIRSALGKEGIRAPEVVGAIVGALRRQGYLDDRRLASHFVQYTVKRRPSGPCLIRRKLRVAGVSEEIIEAEIRETLPSDREREIAEELARKKMRGVTDRAKAARRIHGFLSRRGFSQRTVNSICSAILRGAISGEHDDA
jgi:regulatory protein